MRQKRPPIRLIALLVTLLFMCLPKIVQAGPLSSPLISSYNPPFAQANTWSALQTFSEGVTVSGGTLNLGTRLLTVTGASLFSGASNTGMTFAAEDTGTQTFAISPNDTVRSVKLAANALFGFASSTNLGIANNLDLILVRDAANTLAQRNSTNAQESRIFATYTSATQQHYMALKSAKTTLSAVSGASVTATNLIPDGAFVIGVTTRVNTGLGVSLGTTGYTVGDGTDVDRWGAITGTAAGTDSDNVDATANPTGAFTAANNVVLTATGGNFDGTGDIEVAVLYLTANAD